MFDLCPKKKFFFQVLHFIQAIVVSSSFIVIFQKTQHFLEFVIELTMRLYLSPKASSCRKCDIFWVLAFCCWSKKRGWIFFYPFFIVIDDLVDSLPFHEHLKSLITMYFHYNILFSLLSTIFFSERASSFDRFMIHYELYRIFLWVWKGVLKKSFNKKNLVKMVKNRVSKYILDF